MTLCLILKNDNHLSPPSFIPFSLLTLINIIEELTVHRSCYGGKWVDGDDSNFKCDSCLEFSKLFPGTVNGAEAYKRYRWKISCSYCKQKGGSLSRDASGDWVHDVCRIWEASEIDPAPYCCICDSNERPVVQCVAKGCTVMFHPMCALVSSNASDLKRLSSKKAANKKTTKQKKKSNHERVVEHDTFLCTQFKLSKIEVGSSAVTDLKTVPAAFCGYHNPDRRADFWGTFVLLISWPLDGSSIE